MRVINTVCIEMKAILFLVLPNFIKDRLMELSDSPLKKKKKQILTFSRIFFLFQITKILFSQKKKKSFSNKLLDSINLSKRLYDQTSIRLNPCQSYLLTLVYILKFYKIIYLRVFELFYMKIYYFGINQNK